MTIEQINLKTTAEIFVATIQHMADLTDCSYDFVLKSILDGGSARDRFNEYMRIAAANVIAR